MVKLSQIIVDILQKRGITDPKAVDEFVSPKPKLTYDPFLLPHMKEGVDFVISAIENNERICIYGDYDVDGTTATALLYNFLAQLTDNVTYYIPSRFEDGYGLNNDSLSQLKSDGVDVVITVDCGAVSHNEVEHAKSIGLKIMITDHHNMEEDTVPDCIVINPKHFDSEYPFKGLCGCAVAFKLVQAIVRTQDLDRSNLVRPLDLVAIATVADVVPLVDENRTMVKYGLREVNRGVRRSLKILTDRLDIVPGTIDSYKIGFVIGPHLNAAGRMKDAGDVVRMLTSDDNDEIHRIVQLLIEYNRERRAVQEKCFEESVDLVEEKYMDSPFLMIMPKSIHEGIAGIVAGNIKEKYNKPAIVLSKSGDDDPPMLKGSARSIDNIDLIKMLLSHEELFSKLGGHTMAAGFSMPEANEEALRAALKKDMDILIEKDPHLLSKKVGYDIAADTDDIDMTLAKELKMLAPFGVDNPRPVIKLDDISVNGLRYMGSENQHVKFNCGSFDCILFSNAQEYKDLLESGNNITIYGNPDINTWNGNESVQFLIKTIVTNKNNN